MKPFVHLHLHSEYSLLDGAAKIERLFSACKENNMPAVALTDHGVMYGIIEFYKEAKKAGVKPIIGSEFYVTKDHKDKQVKEMDHLTLLAKDMTGYKNIIKLNSIAFVDGFYYKPRIDFNLLKQYSKGIVCLSGCLAGSVPRLLLKGSYNQAKEIAQSYKDIFEKGDYYIEVQDHGLKEQKYINPLLYKIADEIGVKTVATNDVHYINKEDSEMQDVLLCVQTGKTLDDPQRMKFESDEFYLKNYNQMQALFPDREQALESTLEIAEKCNVDIQFKMPLIPNYIPEDNKTPKQLLNELVEKGLAQRYDNITRQIRQRAESELKIIDSMGFNEYYLIVWDFINYAKKNDIPVGPGRGSGVGSIAAYALGITNVDPLKFNLLFERFLNPERMSMPDFDIDFCFERRNEVIDYVIKKYGADKVAQIITFGTMAAKAAIKDVARVYNVPYAEVDKVTKLIPFGKTNLKSVFGLTDDKQHIPELVQLYKEDSNIKKVVDMAIQLEGMPRNTSTHAAGVVICKETISDYIPLQRNGDDITTQFTMTEVETLGLLKMDFLGLRTLTDIKKTLEYINNQRGVQIDFDKSNYDDKGVYELISEGDTDAVFQLESAGMKRFMKELKPAVFEDIIAGIALYRPGPMDSIPKYISGKKNPDKVSYAHPMLKPILDVTYGCIVYQEQVMQIVQTLAGFSLGQADIIRRAMGKKDTEEMKRQRNTFVYGTKNGLKVDGAIKRGVPEKTAIAIFDDMEDFAKYAFNKSHAAAYAVLAYQTAYLKRYYREEFITAVLNNRITSIDEIKKYINYARKCGIEVLQPDINKSSGDFSVEEGSIRFGLAAIKNCGESAVNMIIAERQRAGKFKGLNDFFERIDLSCINKRLIESFISGGAFDCFGVNRSQLMQAYEPAFNRISKDKKIKQQGQFSLFEMIGEEDTMEAYPDVEEYPLKEKLFAERDVLGVYITGHPLKQYEYMFENTDYDSSMIMENNEDLDAVHEINDKSVIMAGMICDIRKIITKAGKEMAVARLEDLYGSVELILFSKSYFQNRQYLIEDNIVYINGRITVREGENPKIITDSILPFKETSRAVPQKGGMLYLRFDERDYQDIFEILYSYEGGSKVRAKIGEEWKEFPFEIDYCNALKCELLAFIDEEDIVFKE